jgi:ribose-phosphate pyrophosphokinase
MSSTVEPQTRQPARAGQVAPAPEMRTSLPIDYDKRLMVAVGRSSLELGTKIAERLGVGLTDAGLKTFSDGEVYCRYQESIRGADVFIIQSTCGNAEEGITVNDSLMELLVMVEAAVGASAHRVIAVCPWYGYSRQDKKSAPREPITARLVAKMLETAGIDRMLTMDLHAGQMQGFFSKPVDHMTAMPVLTQYVRDQIGEAGDLVIISPDAGRVKLTDKFAQKIGAPYAVLAKERPAQQVAEIGYVIGDVKGKVAVIVDDIIDTGGTLSVAAQSVLDEGATEVHAVATHGIFSGRAFETIEASPLKSIVVTDTVQLPAGAPDRIKVLTSADILTDSVRRIFTDDSVSEIFAGENQLF